MFKKIINDVIQRDIEYLAHFTNTKNLESIFRNGLVSRDKLDEYKMNYEYNDYFRYDNATQSISTSVTSPNYKMFWPIRQDNPDEDWAVLLIDAKKTLNLKCAFCYTNAANNKIRIIDLEQRCTYEFYKMMFEENHPDYSREDLNLSHNEPTNPQAEVLVLENIPTKYISMCLFENHYTYNKYKMLCNNYRIISGYDKGLFYPRHDYKYW